MNKKMLEMRRNDTARLFDFHTVKRNCLTFNRNQSKEHYQKQFELCYEAYSNGEHFLTEAVLDTNIKTEQLRADFVNLDDMEVVEISITEKQESLDRKKAIWEKYGLGMMVIGMQA